MALTEKTARLAFCGNAMVLVALSAGSVNCETPSEADWRAEMGMIRSAGLAVAMSTESSRKKVAVSVVLKSPV